MVGTVGPPGGVGVKSSLLEHAASPSATEMAINRYIANSDGRPASIIVSLIRLRRPTGRVRSVSRASYPVYLNLDT
jgi:hypothetical protein